jgi:hypothetical protein
MIRNTGKSTTRPSDPFHFQQYQKSTLLVLFIISLVAAFLSNLKLRVLPQMPHQILRATAAAVLLFSFVHGQDISIAATSLDQVATDDFLNATCLANANPGIDALSAGDTFAVPLDCCGTESFVCGGAFCTLLAECANLQTGVGTISVTTVASTVTAFVTGTMATSDGTITSTPQASGTDAGTTATTTSTSSDDGGAAGGAADGAGGAGGAGGGGGGTATTGAGTTTDAETTAATTDATQVSTTTQSTTSSSSSSGTPTPTTWLISTKRNTARADFDDFIKTLPDQGQGNVIAYDNIPWQSYVTKNLTSDQADMIKMNSIVDLVGQITEEDGEAGIAATKSKKPRVMKREDSPRAGSDYHLGILSAPRVLMDTETWPDYEFDTQLGKGQTIYIIDTGYRSTHEVCKIPSSHPIRSTDRTPGICSDRSHCGRLCGSERVHSLSFTFRQ